MAREIGSPVVSRVLEERNQGHSTRQALFAELEEEVGRPAVSFFTSFKFPVMITDDDADMLEGILRQMDLSKGLVVVMNSPGGMALAAERIITACRTYSGTGEYWALVPGKAKSAATMVCLGASKIIMGRTSELGTIDPQVTVTEDGVEKRFSVFNTVQSYRELFRRAVRTRTGNLHPYLQQLERYDAREIRECEAALELSEDIAVKALAQGMMNGQTDKRIRERIKVFLTPELKKEHGRPIYRDEAAGCGLEVEKADMKGKQWELVYELYVRTERFVSTEASKCVESKDYSFLVPAPRGEA